MKWLLLYFLIHIIFVVVPIFLRTMVNDQPFDWSLESLACEIKELAVSMLITPLSIGWLPILTSKTNLDDSTPIIFVPGYSLNRLSFWALQRYLRACGYGNSLAINHPVHKNDLTEFSNQLAKVIDDFSWRNQGRPVTLIAHSMGGIVSRTYIENFGANKVASVITIGTPWKGTLMHRIGFTRHVHQMAANSSFCRSPKALSVPHLSIWSSRDSIVLPTRNALHEEHNSLLCSHSGHLGMLFSTDIFQTIRNFLDQAHADSNK
jgi:triacylglycerol lipase